MVYRGAINQAGHGFARYRADQSNIRGSIVRRSPDALRNV
jgi:hypothetical protein